ncbi:MAG: hypothetical protein EBU90_01765 [Proteobacteria bacterium]|nr:hypothetical protein [Pseudomonadota bacterium]
MSELNDDRLDRLALVNEVENITYTYILTNPELKLQFSHMREYLLRDDKLFQTGLFLIEPIFLKLVYSNFLRFISSYAKDSIQDILYYYYERLKTLAPDDKRKEDLKTSALTIAVACFLYRLNKESKDYVFEIGVKKLKKYATSSKRLSENEAMRDNSTKIDHNLFHAVLPEFADCLRAGAEKYSANNWKKETDVHQIKNSLINHLEKFLCGEEDDSDSGNSHLSHILCNCMFLEYHCNSNQTIKELRSIPQAVNKILEQQ